MAETATPVDGSAHLRVKSDGRPYDLLSFSSQGRLEHETDIEDSQAPIRNRLVVRHGVHGKSLWLYTVVFGPNSEFSDARFALVPEADSLSGDALRVETNKGRIRLFHVNQGNRLKCSVIAN